MRKRGDESPFPSPLAGEGASRRRREAGEGALPRSLPRTRARAPRAHLTDAERKLWHALRDRSLMGVKFRRQLPVGPFIADFICFEARLLIEIDGGQHAESRSDERRDCCLAANSFRVMRFWNNEVLSSLDGVLTVIIEALRKAGDGASTPVPLRQRGMRR